MAILYAIGGGAVQVAVPEPFNAAMEGGIILDELLLLVDQMGNIIQDDIIEVGNNRHDDALQTAGDKLMRLASLLRRQLGIAQAISDEIEGAALRLERDDSAGPLSSVGKAVRALRAGVRAEG